MSVAEGSDTTRSALAKGAPTLFISQVIGNIGFFVAVLILARGLGPSGRGVVAFCTVFALIAAEVTNLGVPTATTYAVARDEPSRGQLLTACYTFGFALSAALAGIAVLVLSVVPARPSFIDPKLLLLVWAGAITSAVLESGYGFLMGCQRFNQTFIFGSVAPWLYATLLLAQRSIGELTAVRAVLFWVVARGVAALLMFGASLRLARPGLPNVSTAIRLLSFGLRAWPSSVGRFVNFRVDQIIMGFLAAEAALGIYAVAVNVSEILLYLPSAVASALIPSVAMGLPRTHTAEILTNFRKTLCLTLLALGGSLLFSPVLIPLVFGSAFQGSVLPFVILSFGSVGYTMSAIFSSTTLGLGSPVRSAAGPLVALVVGVILDFALIPPAGANGAALATTAAFLAGGVAAAAVFRRLHPFELRQLVPTARDVRDLASAARSRLPRLRRTRSQP